MSSPLRRLQRIAELEPSTGALTDEQLRARTGVFRERIEHGESLDDLLPEAFACVREAASRTLGMRHRDVQLLAGIALHEGKIAEVAGGEGKTLVATAPAFLNALPRRGVFVVTQNDWLARRDGEGMAPIFRALGMTVGALQSSVRDGVEKVEPYACDITYGTHSVFGFDHLRDNMTSRLENQLQKRHHYAILDDVDTILIDDARIPLIISGMPDEPLPSWAWERAIFREESVTLATITYQNFFRLFDKLAGMTGTATTDAGEFRKVYELDVVRIPTHVPGIRKDAEDAVYLTRDEKSAAIVRAIVELHETGRPVLVGTSSIASSEKLSELLSDPHGVPHQVVNGRNHEHEAQILAQAGRKGAVTILPDDAGRGTDIVLGANDAERREVLTLGGLAVVGTDRHEARRHDDRLRQRCARRGEPGSTFFFLSLQDDLMRTFAHDWVTKMLKRLGMKEGEEIESGMVSRGIDRAQKRMEQRNWEIRKNLREYDFVLDTQRKTIYALRQEILEGAGLRELVLEMCRAKGRELEYEARERALGAERMRAIEKFLLLSVLDSKWKDHLRAMTRLREQTWLLSDPKADPKTEYKKGAYAAYERMTAAIEEEVVDKILRAE